MIKIPNYTVKSELGSNKIATVYLAKNTALDEHNYVALKIVQANIVKNNNSIINIQQFFSDKVVKLEHPYIIKTYDIGITDGNICYMAMEYLENGTLSKKIQQEKMPIASILKIIGNIGTALSYIHDQGFVHCNVKPNNILFDNDNNAKLSDSGFTELQDAASNLALQDAFHYMSPEQLTMARLDKRSDIYSLGLVFYEMLVAEKAFQVDTTAQAIYQHTVVPLPKLPIEYSYLQLVLDKALAKSPRDRYTTIKEMLHTLEVAVDTFNINKITPHLFKTEKPIKEKMKDPAFLHSSLEQKKAKSPWLLKGVIGSVLFTLIVIMLIFTNTITLNNFSSNKVPPDNFTKNSRTASTLSTNDSSLHTNPISFVTKKEDTLLIKNTAEEKHTRNKKSNNSLTDNVTSVDTKKQITPSLIEKNKVTNNTQHEVPISKISINVFSSKNKKPLTTRMTITSKYTGKIIIDGKNLEKGAFSLEVGEYEVHIEKKGYISQSELFIITDAPQSDIIFRLDPIILIGKLKVEAINKKNGRPLRATYEVRSINGSYYKKQTKNKKARFKLPFGRYSLSVKYKGKVIKKKILIKEKNTLIKKVSFNLPSSITKGKPNKPNILSRIYIAAKLGNEKGKYLQANFFLYQNKKIIKKALRKGAIQFKVPPGEYIIKVVYKGVSSQAHAILGKKEVDEQIFVYDDIPVQPN